PGSRSKRKSRAQRRTRQKHAAQGKTLRELGGRASLSGSLGNELGGYAHSRHHETASGRHVRRRKTNLAPAAYRTVPLLPVRRTSGASGWLCRSRSRLLRSTARLDWTWSESPMGRTLRTYPRSQNWTTPARTYTSETGLVSHSVRGSSPANPVPCGAVARPCRPSGHPCRYTLQPHL